MKKLTAFDGMNDDDHIVIDEIDGGDGHGVQEIDVLPSPTITETETAPTTSNTTNVLEKQIQNVLQHDKKRNSTTSELLSSHTTFEIMAE